MNKKKINQEIETVNAVDNVDNNADDNTYGKVNVQMMVLTDEELETIAGGSVGIWSG